MKWLILWALCAIVIYGLIKGSALQNFEALRMQYERGHELIIALLAIVTPAGAALAALILVARIQAARQRDETFSIQWRLRIPRHLKAEPKPRTRPKQALPN